jgi:putative sigma-54 modulation protein
MNIIVNGRHLEITQNLRSYAEDKVGKFDRYISNITEAVITLSIEKYRHKAEVLLKVNGLMIQAEGVTGEIYSAIDEVIEKLERQVEKYKGKLTNRRKGEGKAQAEESAAPASETGRIIKIKQFEVKPMNPEEASMQMELLDKNFFVFTNEQTGEINVIYKRNDGNYGLIEPRK